MRLKHVALALAAFAVQGVSIASAAAPVLPASSLPGTTVGVIAPMKGIRSGAPVAAESNQLVGAPWFLLLLGAVAVGGGIIAATDGNGGGSVSP
jgi:hypothetical protein